MAHSSLESSQLYHVASRYLLPAVFVNKAENVSVTGFGSEATAVNSQDSNGADTSAFSWTYSNVKAGFGY